MRISLIILSMLFLLTLAGPAYSQTPMMSSVQPLSGTVGDTFVVQGENLDDAHVAAVFLTDGKNDLKVPIKEQTAAAVTFTIPQEVKAGRFALMVLTKGKDARYIEEPVKISIELAQAKPTT